MGRLIDCNNVYNAIQITTDNFGVAKRVVEDNMLTMLSEIETVEAIPKADYEARLKADMIAMLTELQSGFEEKEQYYRDKFLESKNTVHDVTMVGVMFGCRECKEDIQQKINELKAEQEREE